jgi:rhodanese-related sulfurtransferase
MRKILFGIFVSLLSFHCGAQKKSPTGMVQSPAFDAELGSLLSGKVPFISVEELNISQSDFLILDAREKEEFDISHLPGAVHIGYKSMDENLINRIDKNQKVALYCSVGYRSEKVGQKLMKLGFQDVSNVYGSIFEWVNQGYPVYDDKEQPTNKVHTYSKNWGRWVNNDQIEKVW